MRGKVWIGAAMFWLLFGMLSGIQVWISMITHGHSLVRVVAFHLIVWAPWIGFTVAIVALSRRWPIAALPVALLRHFGVAMVIGIAHSFWWIELTIALRPFDRMTGVFRPWNVLAFVVAQLQAEIIIYAVILASVHVTDVLRRYREREITNAQLETSLTSARLESLKLQIRPHFLFNALNAISSLVRTGKQHEAVVMIAGVSDLLRYTLQHAGDQSVTLDEESGMLHRYLEIQRTRFPDRLTFTIDIAPEARRAMLPTLILQPLAENAIQHGIAVSAGSGKIAVRAFRDDGNLRIEMFNSGSFRGEREGIGLRNTRERLHRLYGDAQRLDLGDRGDGVVASLCIPWREVA
jgi:two-component system, LytTR family, sensor kinase